MAVTSYVGYFNRSEIQGQSMYHSVAGGIADGTGLGGIYTGATGDIAFTGATEQIGTRRRVIDGTLGVLSVAPVAGVVGRSAAGGLRGLSIGSRTAYFGGGIRGGAFAPAFAVSYPVVTRSAAAASTAATGTPAMRSMVTSVPRLTPQ